MDTFEDLPLLTEEDERKLEAGERPFGGLLGNSVLLRVIEEIMADPHREFRPKNLQILTDSSPPRIKTALESLAAQGLLRKISNDSQRPVYKANLESKRLKALELLAYAVIDNREGTSYMDQSIKDYCSDVLGMSPSSPYAATTNYYVSYNIIYNEVSNITPPTSSDTVDLSKIPISRPAQLKGITGVA